MNATGQRWLNELANFNFSIHYKAGVYQNAVADALVVDSQSKKNIVGTTENIVGTK